MIAFIVVYVALIVFLIITGWKVLEKAGQPGWAILVPIYNIYIFTQVAGRPGWWLLLMLIPIVSFVILIIMEIDVAKKFGKDTGFAVGLILLGIVFWRRDVFE